MDAETKKVTSGLSTINKQIKGMPVAQAIGIARRLAVETFGRHTESRIVRSWDGGMRLFVFLPEERGKNFRALAYTKTEVS